MGFYTRNILEVIFMFKWLFKTDIIRTLQAATIKAKNQAFQNFITYELETIVIDVVTKCSDNAVVGETQINYIYNGPQEYVAHFILKIQDMGFKIKPILPHNKIHFNIRWM